MVADVKLKAHTSEEECKSLTAVLMPQIIPFMATCTRMTRTIRMDQTCSFMWNSHMSFDTQNVCITCEAQVQEKRSAFAVSFAW